MQNHIPKIEIQVLKKLKWIEKCDCLALKDVEGGSRIGTMMRSYRCEPMGIYKTTYVNKTMNLFMKH